MDETMKVQVHQISGKNGRVRWVVMNFVTNKHQICKKRATAMRIAWRWNDNLE